MLSALFASEARTKILNLILIHPEDHYYLRQLARDLNLQLNSVRRELNNLKSFGLILEEKQKEEGKKQDKKYYIVNTNFILFKELQALFIKAQILSSQKFLSKLQEISQPKLLLLTGLFTHSPNSATDLLIVGKVNKNKVLKLIKELEDDLSKEINYTIMDEKEYKYRRDVMDIFLYNILEGEKIILINNLDD